MNSPVSLSRPLAAMFRRTFALLFSAALCSWSTAAQLATDNLPRQEIAIPNFEASGWILDLGGGCRGTIGRMKPDQVVAIDISSRELKEAPNNFLKIVMMYMPPSIHRKVFAEAYRVLQTGGRWLIWDAVVPTVSTSRRASGSLSIYEPNCLQKPSSMDTLLLAMIAFWIRHTTLRWRKTVDSRWSR